MKNLMVMALVFCFGCVAFADLSLECSNKTSQVVQLDLADSWHLRDSSEPSLKKIKKLVPVRESSKAVEFLHDFGSEYARLSYGFNGLEKCGVYGSDEKVVTLKRGLRNINGTLQKVQTFECTCIED